MISYAGTAPQDDEGGIYKFNLSDSGLTDLTQDQGFEIKTKDIDFGFPGVRKKIYAVWITYKSIGTSSTNIHIAYALDGSDNFNGNFADNAGDYANIDSVSDHVVLGGTSGNWHKERLVPSTSVNSAYSIQIKLFTVPESNNNGDVPSSFEIDDMSIVFKTKSVR